MSSGGAQTSSTSGLDGDYAGYLSSLASGVQGAMNLPYQNYQGPRVANLSDTQRGAAEGFNAIAGSPVLGAAQNQLTQTLNGGYTNPYANQANPYAGQSPEFQNILRSGQADITDAYNRGTSADTTRMFNMAGAFGGSAHQNAMKANEEALGKTLGNYTSGMQNDQYNRSAQLAESQIGRGNADYEGERARQMGAVGAGTSLLTGASGILGNAAQVGDLQRQQEQQVMNANYGDWQQAYNYPWSQLQQGSGILGSLLGNAPRNTTTTGPGSDPIAQGLGIMGLGNYLGGSSGGGGKGGDGGGYYGADGAGAVAP